MARLSDAPSEPPEPASSRTLRTVAVGCALSFLGFLLVMGLVGFGVAMYSRFAHGPSATHDEPAEEPAVDSNGLPVPTVRPHDPSASTATLDPMTEMQRRYRPGPHVHLEGLIPGERAYRASGQVSPWSTARAADTPWLVLGATYSPDALPTRSLVSPPTILHAPSEHPERPIELIPHMPTVARVGAADGTGGPDVMQYLVAFDGYPGHFQLPVRVMTELGPVSAGGSEGAAVRFTIGSAQRPDRSFLHRGESYQATMRIAAVDSYGHVSATVERRVNVLPLGQGDLEVAMTMSAATDLDLYVTDPAGAAVYYGNTEGFSGGQLDLDANAACSGNLGVQAEHIFWPQSRAPAGTYSVRVAHYRSCIGGAPVDYRITVRACGETAVLTGRFTGEGSSTACTGAAGDPSWCQEVVSFELPSCRLSN